MSREIPKAAKDEAFKLWLQGAAYREVRDKLGISVGALHEIVAHARAAAPDLDELRELNMVLRKGGLTVYDAIRGGQLLDRLGQLGTGLDRLGEHITFCERIARRAAVHSCPPDMESS